MASGKNGSSTCWTGSGRWPARRRGSTRYLDELTRIGLMRKHKIGRESYYMNRALLDLLGNIQAV